MPKPQSVSFLGKNGILIAILCLASFARRSRRKKKTCPECAEKRFFEKEAFYGMAVCFKVDLL